MAGRADELPELQVGHRSPINPEAVDGDAMARRLLGIMMIGSHAKRPAGNEDHLAGPQIIRQPLAVTQVRPQHRGNSDTRIPPDATARNSATVGCGRSPYALGTLSGPLFLAPDAGDDDGAMRQHLLPFLRARLRASGKALSRALRHPQSTSNSYRL